MTDLPTQTTAIAHIDAVLYEEGREAGFYYEFSDLRDRFQEMYNEAIEDEDDFVTIKIPSYYENYEIGFHVTTVGLALGR